MERKGTYADLSQIQWKTHDRVHSLKYPQTHSPPPPAVSVPPLHPHLSRGELSHYSHSHCASVGRVLRCHSWWHGASPSSLCCHNTTSPLPQQMMSGCPFLWGGHRLLSPTFCLILSLSVTFHRLLVCAEKGLSLCHRTFYSIGQRRPHLIYCVRNEMSSIHYCSSYETMSPWRWPWVMYDLTVNSSFNTMLFAQRILRKPWRLCKISLVWNALRTLRKSSKTSDCLRYTLSVWERTFLRAWL